MGKFEDNISSYLEALVEATVKRDQPEGIKRLERIYHSLAMLNDIPGILGFKGGQNASQIDISKIDELVLQVIADDLSWLALALEKIVYQDGSPVDLLEIKRRKGRKKSEIPEWVVHFQKLKDIDDLINSGFSVSKSIETVAEKNFKQKALTKIYERSINDYRNYLKNRAEISESFGFSETFLDSLLGN